MNKISLHSALLWIMAGFLLSGCNDQLDINANGDSVPVIYSLINPKDSVHYLRLTRSFNGNQSASVLARDSSFLYYSQAEVYLEIVSDLGWPVKYASFTPVIGPDREPGTFLEKPNLIYSLKANLNSYLFDNYTIRVIVNIPELQKYCSAAEKYFTSPEILLPTPSRKTMINLYFGEPIQIKWEDKYGYSYYQVQIRYNYTEFFNRNQGEMESLDTSASVSFYHKGEVLRPNEKTSSLFHILDGNTFLKLLAQNMPSVKSLSYRKFNSFDIVIFSASSSYREYLESFEITTDRFGLPVSNVAGGTGLFSIIASSEHDGYLLDKQSLDSLCDGQFTNSLGFIRW